VKCHFGRRQALHAQPRARSRLPILARPERLADVSGHRRKRSSDPRIPRRFWFGWPTRSVFAARSRKGPIPKCILANHSDAQLLPVYNGACRHAVLDTVPPEESLIRARFR
jgi:hypothetical protein